MTILENYHRIKNEIDSVAQGRSIQMVAVGKGQPPEKIQELLSLPKVIIANNYVQEGARVRSRFLEFSQIEWHFIGHIQSRKAKELVDYHWVQSLDRVEVAKKLNDQLQALGKKIDCLVEVNIGSEAQKSGVAIETVSSFLEALRSFEGLRVRGLMAMPPLTSSVEERRPYFSHMKKLFDSSKKEGFWDTLSMGTSDDYLVAISEGATMVRLGSCLFGPRPLKLET